MPRTVYKCSPNLSIALEDDNANFYPGDTINGAVRRTSPIVSTKATVRVKFLGRTKSLLTQTSGDSSATYRGRFTLLEHTQRLFCGPVHVPEGADSPREWPFSVQIPETVDGTLFPAKCKQKESYLALDSATVGRLPLPGSFYSKNSSSQGFVEYYIEATIWFEGKEKEFATATLPIHILTSAPPLRDFQLHRFTALVFHIGTQRLIPGMENAELSAVDKMKKLLGTSSVPKFAFKVEVGIPKVLQRGSDKISFEMRVIPDWATTSEGIRNVPQKVWLIHFTAEMEARIDIKCAGGWWSATKDHWKDSVSLITSDRTTSSSSSRGGVRVRRRLIEIPCSNKESPVNVGRALNLRMLHPDKPLAPQCPGFTTFNIKVGHKMKWSAKIEIAGETVCLNGSQELTLLPGIKKEKSEEKDDSWIKPPAVADELPSFAEVQKEVMQIGKMLGGDSKK